ncbi:outer membrane beta-barrel protein [Bacteroides sp.]|uniref:outer membrane beta-barrel protein n=1 Tax=Bacteroides sp. TaxID=29523 RepID=UPI002607D939|nr:outer membrane beta-barrel protein [Bacteroides sp.]
MYAMGQWNTSTGGRFYAGVGPYFGMGLSAKMKDSDIDLYKKVNGETPMSRMVVGGAAQIGYEFNFGLQINATYKLGITNSLDSMKDDAKMNSQTVSLGIGYRF